MQLLVLLLVRVVEFGMTSEIARLPLSGLNVMEVEVMRDGCFAHLMPLPQTHTHLIQQSSASFPFLLHILEVFDSR